MITRRCSSIDHDLEQALKVSVIVEPVAVVVDASTTHPDKHPRAPDRFAHRARNLLEVSSFERSSGDLGPIAEHRASA